MGGSVGGVGTTDNLLHLGMPPSYWVQNNNRYSTSANITDKGKFVRKLKYFVLTLQKQIVSLSVSE